MCLIISVIGVMFAFNFFMANKLLLAFISLAVSIFFIYLMINNILYVKKLKKEKK